MMLCSFSPGRGGGAGSCNSRGFGGGHWTGCGAGEIGTLGRASLWLGGQRGGGGG